jgi:hypothetical protein
MAGDAIPPDQEATIEAVRSGVRQVTAAIARSAIDEPHLGPNVGMGVIAGLVDWCWAFRDDGQPLEEIADSVREATLDLLRQEAARPPTFEPEPVEPEPPEEMVGDVPMSRLVNIADTAAKVLQLVFTAHSTRGDEKACLINSNDVCETMAMAMGQVFGGIADRRTRRMARDSFDRMVTQAVRIALEQGPMVGAGRQPPATSH